MKPMQYSSPLAAAAGNRRCDAPSAPKNAELVTARPTAAPMR